MAPSFQSRQFEVSSEIAVSSDDLSAWHFRSGAFQRLAPPWERVELLHSDGPIREASRVVIRMQKGPLPIRWVAEHRDVRPGVSFQDVQVKGPFRLWEHSHLFESTGPGTSRLTDRIRWALPGGRLGQRLGGSSVQSDLERTFRYRHAVTEADLRMHSRWSDRPRLRVALLGRDRLVAPALEAMLTTGGHEVVESPAGDSDSRLDALVDFRGGLGEGSPAQVSLKSLIPNSPSLTVVVRVAPLSSTFPHVVPDLPARIRTVGARLGIVLSPREGALSRLLTLTRLGLTGAGPEDLPRLSWITVDDAAAAILQILLNGETRGDVLLASAEQVTLDRLWSRARHALSRSAGISLPASLIRKLLGRTGGQLRAPASDALTQRPPELELRHPDLEGALHHLLGLGR